MRRVLPEVVIPSLPRRTSDLHLVWASAQVQIPRADSSALGMTGSLHGEKRREKKHRYRAPALTNFSAAEFMQ